MCPADFQLQEAPVAVLSKSWSSLCGCGSLLISERMGNIKEPTSGGGGGGRRPLMTSFGFKTPSCIS